MQTGLHHQSLLVVCMLLAAGRLNVSKTKDMVIDFRKSQLISYSSSPAIRWTVTGTGVVLDETTKTFQQRLFFLRRMRSFNVSEMLQTFY